MGRPQDCSCQCCSTGDHFYIPVNGFGGVSLDRIEKRLRSTGALTNTWTQLDMLQVKSLDDVPHFYQGGATGRSLKKYNLYGFSDIEELWEFEETDVFVMTNTTNFHQIAVDAEYNVHFACRIKGSTTENVNQRFRVRKLDNDGNSLWAYTLAPSGDDAAAGLHYRPAGVAVSKAGKVFAGGERFNSAPLGSPLTSGHIDVCLDADGNVLWSDISSNLATLPFEESFEFYSGKAMFDESENIYTFIAKLAGVGQVAQPSDVGLKSLTPSGDLRYEETFALALANYHVIDEDLYTIHDDDTNLNYVVNKRSAADPTSVTWTKEFAYENNGRVVAIAADCTFVYFAYSYSVGGVIKSKIYKLRASSGGEVWEGNLSDDSDPTGMLLEPGFPPVF